MKAAVVIAWLVATGNCGGGKCAVPSRPEIAGGPYCGVYCVYAALTSFGNDVEFPALLEPKYVGSSMGSTLAELRSAATDFGAYAVPMQNLTAGSLRTSRHPIVLHVRRPGLDMPYAHWILFLGMEGEFARIVDPPHSVQLLELPVLLALWDGSGLVVAPSETSAEPIRAIAYLEQLIILGLGLAACIGLRAAFPKRRFGGPIVLVGASVGAALLYHLLHDQGILINQTATAQVVGNHFKPALVEVSAEDVQEQLAKGDLILIDARFPNDYAAGHLPSAVNLPVYSGLVERRDMLAKIRPGQHVVVYCQSESCPWGDVIAADLTFRGYKHVAVYRGGYAEWRKLERGTSDP